MMKRWIYRLLLIVGSSIVLCGCGGEDSMVFFPSQTADITYDEKDAASVILEDKPVIMVYVCGAVKEPGVVEISAEARVVDAVALAGGMTEEADETYINLACKLTDGEKVYVPTRSEVSEWKLQESQEHLVNINTADVKELCELPGIGESKAEDIIAYREKNGAFQTKEELMNVPGIKESLFEKIADKIKVK